MSKNKSIAMSDFYCTCCGKKGIPIIRKMGKLKESGHLKKLYCLFCKKETNHCEIRSCGDYTYFDFQEEFRLGRFVDGNRVPLNDLLKCNKITCQYCVNKRCWNYTKSLTCNTRGEI